MAFIIRYSVRSPVARQVASQLSFRARALPIAITSRQSFARNYSAHGDAETFEEFNARFEKEFENAYDPFEVQRILSNCFSYDHVPSPTVITKALEAARRVNDFATAVRVLEAIKLKVPAKHLYDAYIDELKDIREQLGIPLKEELFPDSK
ncbi:cytochrome c oxidase subunit VA-domain-containing protein [Lipomyces tetrasporus]|uniref:Cytochrome c oxidase subunit 6, mitochondrial n=1 Tax=Lipomyces tetrasporus TaxID=54092 RepID=A0AAD7QLG3_9ASCO|nr:cytochrome c oxidase subunit VA-domain-containing protein [Lipomyces tetrasporus]KAJ8097467.1 cytochrome c oxidase subunit VA-domain-containing protein [Lipomyces tetrasporus]